MNCLMNLCLANSYYVYKSRLFHRLVNPGGNGTIWSMRDLLALFLHFLTTLARLLGPGRTRAVIAETLLIKHQLVILNRSRRRAPNLTATDRIVMGLCTLFMNPSRIRKVAAALKSATLLAFHRAMKERKYRRLFSPQRRGEPGPKGALSEQIGLSRGGAFLSLRQCAIHSVISTARPR